MPEEHHASRSLLTGAIDAEAHPATRRGWADLEGYVSSGWARRLANFAGLLNLDRGPEIPLQAHGNATPRVSDPDLAAEELFVRRGLAGAILLPLESLNVAEILAPDDTVQLSRAYNEYFSEQWLSVDPRFGLLITVSPHDSRGAAAEIERMAGRAGVVGVALPVIDVLMGDRHYGPIFSAAEAARLPVVVHTGQRPFQGMPTYGGGAPGDSVQRYCLRPQLAMSNVVSLVLSGTFERHPGLKVVFAGSGFGWLPDVLRMMDHAWGVVPEGARRTAMIPSESVHRHVRFTTGDEWPDLSEAFGEVVRPILEHQVLLYGSDYPYVDSERQVEQIEALEEKTRAVLMRDGALSVFPLLTASDVVSGSAVA